MSRLYGGIHYPMGNENGAVQGRCIGRHVLARVHSRRSERGDSGSVRWVSP